MRYVVFCTIYTTSSHFKGGYFRNHPKLVFHNGSATIPLERIHHKIVVA